MSPPTSSLRVAWRGLLVGAVLATTVASSAQGTNTPQAADPTVPAPPGFSVFDRPRNPARDDLPTRLAKLLGVSSADSPQLTGSRRLGDYARGGRVWVVPSSTQPCVVAQMPNGGSTTGSCTTAAGFERLGTGGITSVPGGYAVWGAVPDRVTRLTIVVPGHATRTIAPHANGYSTRVAGQPRRIVVRTAHGVAKVYEFPDLDRPGS
jgi:hypothetical protein